LIARLRPRFEGFVVVAMESLLLQEALVLPLRGVPPLLEGFRSFQIDTGISQGFGETSGKESESGRIVEIHASEMSEHLELRDELVDVS
jgi:hypothetical protein